jgi:hypothetical protein
MPGSGIDPGDPESSGPSAGARVIRSRFPSEQDREDPRASHSDTQQRRRTGSDSATLSLAPEEVAESEPHKPSSRQPAPGWAANRNGPSDSPRLPLRPECPDQLGLINEAVCAPPPCGPYVAESEPHSSSSGPNSDGGCGPVAPHERLTHRCRVKGQSGRGDLRVGTPLFPSRRARP